MSRPELKERIKRSFCLLFAAVMILTVTISTGNVFAASTSNPQTISRMKIYYSALAQCVQSGADHYYQDSSHFFGWDHNYDGSSIKSWKIFHDGTLSLDEHQGLFVGAEDFGAYPESVINGKYEDGRSHCGNSDNKLVKDTLALFDVDLIDFVCDFRDNTKPGVFKPASSTTTCDGAFNDPDADFLIDDNRASYFQTLMESKLKSVTGDNSQSLSSYSNLENYFVYQDAFLNGCASKQQKAELSNPGNYPYQVKVWDNLTQQFVLGGFSGGNASSVMIRHGLSNVSCSDIASRISNGSYWDAFEQYFDKEYKNGLGRSADDIGAITAQTITGVSEDLCYDGAGAIGWVLCPIVTTASDLLQNVYETIEKEYLQIDAINLFSRRMDGTLITEDASGSNVPDQSTLHLIWAAFRDIANIIIVIFLLVVIFSQVTGLGIDNYGIKRMLPRLIIAAILANLSYFVCELAVDMSNIIGIGIKDIFSDFTQRIVVGSTPAVGSSTAQNFVVMGGLLTISIAVLLVSPGLILTLVCFLITMVISVLFIWIILIVRQAGLILAIGISPLAFMCHILPNTERLWKRWLDLMRNLLFLYPICSFIISGGLLAGKIFASMNTSGDGSSVGLTLAAMIVPVIPYLFIPTLLRNSINAMGRLGATLNRIGHTVTNGTVGRFQRSDASRRARTVMNNWDAGGVKTRLASTRFGRVTGLQTMQRNRINAREKLRNDDRAAQALLQRERFNRLEQRDPNNVSLNAFSAQLDRAANNANGGDRTEAIFSEVERRYGASKAANLAAEWVDRNQDSALLAGRNREEFMRRFVQNHQSTFAKTPDFAKYLQMGGTHSVGGQIRRTSFSGTNRDLSANFLTQDIHIGDFKDNQLAGANPETVHRMISAGKIAQADANRIMANEDIRGTMDSVQQLIFAAHGNRNNLLTTYGLPSNLTLRKGDAEALLAGNTTWRDSNGALQNVPAALNGLSTADRNRLINQLIS